MPLQPEYISPVLGIVVSLVSQWLRKATWFTAVTPDNKTKAKALAGILAAVSAVVASYASGTVDEAALTEVAHTGVAFVQTLGVSALFHHWVIKDSNKSANT